MSTETDGPATPAAPARKTSRVAIGCLAAFVVLCILGAAGAWYAFRKVRSTVGQFAELASAHEIERSVRNQAAYTPPPSGELTAAQVDRLLRVQGAVRARLGREVEEMERKYRTLLNRKDVTAGDLPSLISAYGDLAKTFVSGKRAMVDALNQTGLSLTEYRWVRTQAYGALGLRAMDVDITRIFDDVRNGRVPDLPDLSLPPVAEGPESNRTLVEPHRKALEDNIGLAFFGL